MNLKKKKICMCVYLNHFAVHLKLTQHCKPTILQFFKKTVQDLGRANASKEAYSLNFKVKLSLLTVFNKDKLWSKNSQEDTGLSFWSKRDSSALNFLLQFKKRKKT